MILFVVWIANFRLNVCSLLVLRYIYTLCMLVVYVELLEVAGGFVVDALLDHWGQAPRRQVTEGKVCVGCVYEKGGQNFQEFGPVILASGALQNQA